MPSSQALRAEPMSESDSESVALVATPGASVPTLPPANPGPMRPAGNLFPSLDRLALFERVAVFIVTSKEFTKRFPGSDQQATAKVMVTLLKADSLGISLNDALEHVYVVDGKTGLSGQLMLRLIIERAPDCTFEILESTDKVCKILMGRPGHKPTEFSFTVQRAERAGLLHRYKDGEKKEQFVWKAYREEMLQWRVIAKAARVIFPDILQGCYLLDELTAGPDLGDAHAPDWAVQQEHRDRGGQQGSRQRSAEPPKDRPLPKGHAKRNHLTTLVGQVVELKLKSKEVEYDDDRLKEEKLDLWRNLCNEVLGHVPAQDEDVLESQIDAMTHRLGELKIALETKLEGKQTGD